MKCFILAALLAVASAYPPAKVLVQELGPTERDQAPGPSTRDQALGPSVADQARGPNQVYDPTPGAFTALAAAAPSANEASLNKINAERQHAVNRKALYYGASAGTAPYYGVPGTSVKGLHNGAYYGAHDGLYNEGYGYGHHSTYNGAYGHGYNGAYNGAYHHGAYYAH